jgi:putative addiction module component (TIGR02574 family)
MSAIDVSSLSVDERLQLLDEIWESLYATPEAIPLLDSQREELDRRIAAIEQEGSAGASWEEVEARIRGRLKSCR